MVFPCKLCGKNINDKDAAIQCDVCHFRVHLVYHVAVVSLAQYLIKFTMKYPIKTALPS